MFDDEKRGIQIFFYKTEYISKVYTLCFQIKVKTNFIKTN